MKVYVVYHLFQVNDFLARFKRTLEKIRVSKLSEVIDKIIVSTDRGFGIVDSKIDVVQHVLQPGSQFHEYVTLDLLRTLANQEDAKFLYLHSKGVTKPSDPCIQDWIDLMEYFLIEQHATCLEKLDSYDVVGVNLKQTPVRHFSGNFWWSKSSHIRTLAQVDRAKHGYFSGEFWIANCSKLDSKFLSLHDSGVNHYNDQYPQVKYVENRQTIGQLQQLYEQHQDKVSDKWTGYLDRYETLFAPFRDKPISLLEIGVQNGGSLELWAKYFRKAKRIVGIDIDPKCGELTFDDSRIKVVVGDATLAQDKVMDDFDIIIDDGSHRDPDVVKGFSIWFDRLRDDGFYIVEDMHACPVVAPDYFVEMSKRLARNQQVAGVYSVEFLNSLVIVHKRSMVECGLGTRFIAGQIESVAPGHKRLHGTKLGSKSFELKASSSVGRAQP